MGTTLQNKVAAQSPRRAAGDRLPLVSSVLGALAYADLFDAPLSAEEIHKYQITTSYSRAEIAQALSSEPDLIAQVVTDGTYYCLKEREGLFSVRAERAEASRKVWERARRYAGWLRRLPFVRMVAVTGALAVDNVNGRYDIDLLVISRPGRVWLCRRGLIGWVRVGRLLGDDLCPNYILSEGSLELAQRDFFTAHELAQMVPVYGERVYERMLRANEWASTYLPALAGMGSLPEMGGPAMRPGPVERVLRGRAFDPWERWELERLRRKLRSQIGRDAEVVLTPDQCKGHTGLHRAAVMTRFVSKLAEMGLQDVAAALEEAQI
ncbi:MAG TPA: hypothetical protein VND68_13440, partial [Chloroflexia bacterium]|nr:hypothetical protein [Chloroflexia bacterium]